LQKGALVLAAALVVFLLNPAHRAYAHFPATAGNITALLHIEPDDYPAAGQSGTIYFIFSDQTNHFQLAKCNCKLSISQQGQELYYAELSQPPAGQLTIYSTKGIPFTFSDQGSYSISISGRPSSAGALQPFSLNWNFYVAGAAKSDQGFSAGTFLRYFAAILIGFLILGLVLLLFS
jgi:hypothetical protein